jgi:argonaute-like protein implicated in RNA metabolism and viral defense
MPARGTCIRIAHSQFLLYTEGMEDLRSAARRTPCSVQIRLRHVPNGVDPLSLVAQVYDLSQVNFRAFNGASKPVSLLYSEIIARALKHEDLASALAKHPELNERMWFL